MNQTAYLEHKNRTQGYHHDAIACCEYLHSFDTVPTCVHIRRSDDRSERGNRDREVDSYSENIRR